MEYLLSLSRQMPVSGTTNRWQQREEDAETQDHLLQPSASAIEPTFPEDAVPGAARAGRTGCQPGPHADAGQSSSLHFYAVVVAALTHTRESQLILIIRGNVMPVLLNKL